MTNGDETNSIKARLEADSKFRRQRSQDLINTEFINFERGLRSTFQSVKDTIENDTDDLMQNLRYQSQNLQSSQRKLTDQINQEISETAKSLMTWRKKIAGIIALSWISGVIVTTLLAMLLMSLALPQKIRVEVPVNSPSLMEYHLSGTRLIRGVGGLGVLVKLPANLQETPCPPLEGAGGICLKVPREEK